MVFQKEYLPQFREADAGGRIGVRGYLNYFQDAATHFMHNIDKGNDVIPEKYDVCWMFTKYHMQVLAEADFTSSIQMETWIEKIRASSIVQQEIVISRDGVALAKGSLESCLFDRKKNSLTRLEAVEFPMDAASPRGDGVGFTRMPRRIEGMEEAYSHTVRFTDLDKTRHMTNLRYINLMLDAYGSAFYDRHGIKDFEIHYVSQCFEGEEIRICKKEEDGVAYLSVLHMDGTVAAQGRMILL